MLPLTQDRPKCLMALGESTVLQRLIKQLVARDLNDICVVVGYMADRVINEISANIDHPIDFIENTRYKEDINILSLCLALEKKIEPCFIFEADCIFSDECLDLICSPEYKDSSVWYSSGVFTEEQYGGIIQADAQKKVTDVKIVDKYESKYKDYHKMIGALKISESHIGRYAKYLFSACQKNIKQYYHMPWIQHIDEFESLLCDMGHLKLASFNTIETYYMVREMFK